MGKSTRAKSVSISIPHSHPRRMWGSLLHVLNYQHWHWRSIKKRLPHKKHDGTKPEAEAEKSEDDVQASSNDDSSKYRKAEIASSRKAEGKKKHCSSANKHSVKSRLKALFTEEMSRRKGGCRHRRGSTCPARSQLTQRGLIHHAEAPIDDTLPETLAQNAEVVEDNKQISSDSSSGNQVLAKPITSDENGDESIDDQVDESKKQIIENAAFSLEDENDRKQAFLKPKSIISEDGSAHHSNHLVDALNIINPNKAFLEKILQDPGSPLAYYFHKKQAACAKMGLTKSGTFPSPCSSSRRSSELNRKKRQQDATEFNAKEKESEERLHEQKSPSNESAEDICRKSMPLIAADHRADEVHQLNQAKAEIPDIYSSGSSSHHLEETGGNQVAKRRFKHLKQKINYAIKESKNDRYRIAMDAVLHKIPHKKGFSKDLTKDVVDYFKDPSSIKKVLSESSSSKRLGKHDRRASSFNYSIDRYMQLYESSFNTEAKEHISQRIQERREEEMALPRRVSRPTLGRILSSPELHSCYNFDHNEDIIDAFSLDLPTTVADRALSISSSTDQQKTQDFSAASGYPSQSETYGETEPEDNVLGVRERLSASLDQLGSISSINRETVAQQDDVSQTEKDSKPGVVPLINLEELSPVPLLNFNFEGKIASPAEISISQDLELKHSQGFPDELELLNDELLDDEFRDTTEVAGHRVEYEIVEALKRDLDSEFLRVQVHTDDKDKFKYVRDALELSGFSGNEALGRWYADDRPLNPLVFEQKGCIFCDPRCSIEEEAGYCNHPLLFDLINEVLMELYERSYSYYPRPLSSLCHIRTMPIGERVLKEVWENIIWYLSFDTGYDKPLDYVATRDLTRSDGWMNLQFDNECVGLELEELIFDDILEELTPELDQVHSY